MRGFFVITTVLAATLVLAPQPWAKSPSSAAPPVAIVHKAPAPSVAATTAQQNELAALYEKYRKALQAGDLDAMMRYMTAKNREKMQGSLAKANVAQRLLIKKMLQLLAPPAYTITGSTVALDKRSATLFIQGTISFMGKDTVSVGTISFVKDGNEWKIDNESWNSKG